jgi:hypothetical protein
MQKTVDRKKLHNDIINFFVSYCMERSTRKIDIRANISFKFTCLKKEKKARSIQLFVKMGRN